MDLYLLLSLSTLSFTPLKISDGTLIVPNNLKGLSVSGRVNYGYSALQKKKRR